MKQSAIRLSQRYVAALRRHRKLGPRASSPPALRLGQHAVALRLETLELVRIHERALAKLKLSHSQNWLIQQAKVFFTEAIIPLVLSHRAARQSQRAGS